MASVSNTNSTVTESGNSLNLTSNFATQQQQQKSSSENPLSIGYDHEVYLQLVAGQDPVAKTPNQVFEEERAQRLKLRAQDPAVSDPQNDPSPIDFECAENQLKKNPPRSLTRNSGSRS